MLSNKLSVVLSVCVVCIMASAAYAQGPTQQSYIDNISTNEETNQPTKQNTATNENAKKTLTDLLSAVKTADQQLVDYQTEEMSTGNTDKLKLERLISAKSLADKQLTDYLSNTINSDHKYSAITFLGTGGAGTGSSGSGGVLIGYRLDEPDEKSISMFMNLNGQKTISGTARNFGSSILNPGTEGFGGFLDWTHRASKMRGILHKDGNDSWNMRFGFSALNWRDESVTSTTDKDISCYVVYGSFGLQHIWSSGDGSGNQTQIGYIFGITGRYIGGDLSQHKDFLERTLGTSKRGYIGAEWTLFARTKTTQPYIRLTYIPGSNISGLSDVQAFAGVDVFGDITKSESTTSKTTHKESER